MPTRPLIIRLCNWVGDVVLAVPTIRLLQQHGHAPQMLGKSWAPALLAGEPWPVHARAHGLRANVALLRRLRREAIEQDAEFDRRTNALALPTSFSSALEMRLAGMRCSGYAREGRSPLLHSALPAPAYGDHVLMRYWHLGCHFLGIEAPAPIAIDLKTAAADQASADALLAAHGIRPGFIVVCPMAGGTFEKLDKSWPLFGDFTQALKALGRDVVACPGPGEEALLAQQHPGVQSLSGVRLGIYGGVLRRAALVVANDTGPAHLAAAVGAPLLSVLGPTLPSQWAPWGPSVEVIRQWPRWPSVDQVLDRTDARLAA